MERCKKKWGIVRDGFKRQQTKKTTGQSAAEIRPVDSSLEFLLNTSIVKRTTTSNIPSEGVSSEKIPSEGDDSMTQQTGNSLDCSGPYGELPFDNINSIDYNPSSPPFCSSRASTSHSYSRPHSSASDFLSSFTGDETLNVEPTEQNTSKTRKPRSKVTSSPPMKRINREEVLETLLNRQPFVPMQLQTASSPIQENLEKFFSGIIDTMKDFPKYQIAKLKLEIGSMVGKMEMENAASELETVQFVYVQNNGAVGANEVSAATNDGTCDAPASIDESRDVVTVSKNSAGENTFVTM